MNECSSDKADVVDQVTDSFVGELRAGGRPSIDDYLERYPELAEQLAELLPAIALLEQHAAICNSRNSERCQAALPSHQEIGEFTIIREIGRGGMGVVYEAMQEPLGRHVALKVLSMPALLNAKHLERFRFEARAAARLQHRHIVPVFGVGEFNGLHYYAMQFIHGKSLHEVLFALRQLSRPASANDESPAREELTNGVVAKLLPNERPSSIEQRGPHYPLISIPKSRDFYRNVARIGLQATEALAYAHSEGVLHRDIKPSNLLLDASGNVWVTDFGLAKTEGTEDLTETGDFVGTLRYMAPERLEGVLDRRSDIYSLGATLYELLTLQSFFETNSHARLVDQILHESPPLPSRFERSIPRDLETIVLKAIAKEPAARYRTAEEMAEDLRCFLADRPILSRRPSAREQLARWCRRNPLVATLATTIVLLLLAAIVILTRSNARIRNEVVAKDKALESAHHAVHQLLARVANEKLDNVPMSHPLRVELLEDAVKAYEELLAQGDTGDAIRLQIADVSHSIAGLERELGRYTDAEAALKRSTELYESLVASDPSPPAVREVLGMVQMDLAYTWQSDVRSPDFKTFPIESQYRQALATFDAIEHEWPKRRQPVTMCFRYLAEVANHRGDRAQAEQLWRDSIARGESYLKDQPKNLEARNDVCWACQEYYEAILSSSPNRAEDAKAILAKGVQHAEEMRRQQPDSVQAVDVLASLHFRQALVCCREDRIDDAIPIFHTAIEEVEYLCESVPWNDDYWNTAQWFHEESIKNLHKANKNDEIDALTEQTNIWLRKLSAKVVNDSRSQQKVQETQTAFVKLLRSIHRDYEADEFAGVSQGKGSH
jgi:serine/threonine protein kinase